MRLAGLFQMLSVINKGKVFAFPFLQDSVNPRMKPTDYPQRPQFVSQNRPLFWQNVSEFPLDGTIKWEK